MDDGIIALVAAGVGLIGAIGGAAIGGAAAARGARIGAETAARATEKQVSDQADADHGHWIRDQRLEAYRAMLLAYEAYIVAASAAQRVLEGAVRELDDAERTALSSAVRAVMSAYFTVRLVGPVAVKDQALQIRMKVDDHVDYMSDWNQAAVAADEGRKEEARTQANLLRPQLARLHSDFVTAGTATLTPVERTTRQAN